LGERAAPTCHQALPRQAWHTRHCRCGAQHILHVTDALAGRRGPKPQNNRQILNGMYFILRAGCPGRDLPERYGPYTTVYNRFNRWRMAGVWDM